MEGALDEIIKPLSHTTRPKSQGGRRSPLARRGKGKREEGGKTFLTFTLPFSLYLTLMITRVLLIRHGQSQVTPSAFSGHSATALSSVGRQQARDSSA